MVRLKADLGVAYTQALRIYRAVAASGATFATSAYDEVLAACRTALDNERAGKAV